MPLRGVYLWDVIKLLVFDLDGTLADTRHDLANSVNAALMETGYAPLGMQTVINAVGDGARNLLARCLTASLALSNDSAKFNSNSPTPRPFSDPELDRVLQSFLTNYRSHCMLETRAYPGVPEALEKLSVYRKAVLTNKPETPAREILSGLGLAHHFERIVGGDNPHGQKPNPEALLALITDFGIAPNEAVMIGDGIQDFRVSRNAGTGFIGFLNGMGPRQLLLDEKPQYTVEHLQELPDAVHRLKERIAASPTGPADSPSLSTTPNLFLRSA